MASGNGRSRDYDKAGFSIEHAGSVISGPDEASVRKFVSIVKTQAEKASRWPRDGREAMTALSRLFPTLRGVPGTDPWDVDAFLAWSQSGALTSGSGWAARFLLSVWNPRTDWREYGFPGAGRFDLMEAWDLLDDPHRAAIRAWLDAPFWP